MNAQVIGKGGRKEFAIIPYKEFVRMQGELEDYRLLKLLRAAKKDSRNKKGRPFAEAARELGLLD